MAEDDLPEDVPRALRLALSAVVAPFRPVLAEAGLTEQQWRVLRAVQSGPASASEVAEACAIPPASLTGVLRRMEQHGLLHKEVSPDDRRSVIVSLAPQGRAAIDEVIPQVRGIYDELLEVAGVDVFEDLLRSATAFVRSLDRRVETDRD